MSSLTVALVFICFVVLQVCFTRRDVPKDVTVIFCMYIKIQTTDSIWLTETFYHIMAATAATEGRIEKTVAGREIAGKCVTGV